MSLRFTDAEALRLIRELVVVTGESQADAVATSVKERLQRIRAKRGERLADRLVAIGKDCAARLGPEAGSVDHATLLYGHDGLPSF